jgi:hypothetical protein
MKPSKISDVDSQKKTCTTLLLVFNVHKWLRKSWYCLDYNSSKTWESSHKMNKYDGVISEMRDTQITSD